MREREHWKEIDDRVRGISLERPNKKRRRKKENKRLRILESHESLEKGEEIRSNERRRF